MSVEKLAKKVLEKGKVDDLILLDEVSEAAIVNNIRARFQSDLIYTSIGSVLVSMNPFKTISGLYTPGMIKAYDGAYSYERAPHIYGLAEETFRQLLSSGKNQCVLVSGESGAGKTEATKKILEYVSAVSNNTSSSHTGKSVAAIKDKLLESNPVMEAFGNAKTLRNDNSSRFGKYMVVDFDLAGTPLGARINQYLLEKPRVVKQQEGERNFHVFYFLLAGGSSSLKQELGLDKAQTYEYTKTTTTVKGINDDQEFKEMDQALDVLLGAERKKHMYTMVAAVLQIGNVTFKQAAKNCDASGLDSAAKNLQVDTKTLGKALTFKTIRTLREAVSTPFTSVEECIKTRDALAKALYARAFKQLVAFLNETLSSGSGSSQQLQLGLLDIFGFEIFKRNSFEQLLINYTNERLQQIFVRLTLESEQADKKPAGVLAYCDEECIVPNGSDKSLLSKLNSKLGPHAHYQSLATSKNNDGTEFTIKHYAGDVTYSSEGFLEKNMDLLYRDLVELMGSSKSKMLQELFPEALEKHDGKKPITAGSQFRIDMQNLVDDLMKCDPHYVRTIKPNDNKQSGNFDEARVAHQVRYLGLLENVRVRRAGFAYRHTFKLFVHRYQMICPSLWLKPKSGDLKRDSQAILDSMAISGSGTTYALGKTKIFIKRPETLFSLEEMRETKMHDVARMIQSCWKSYKARQYFMALREKSLGIFNGKKRRRGSWILYFQGDYINAKSNSEFRTVLQTKFQLGDAELRDIIFADQCEILGKKHKLEYHYVIFTSKNMYISDLQWKLPRKIDLVSGITSYTLTTFADGFMGLTIAPTNPKKPEADLVLYSVRKAEILTLLSEKGVLGSKLVFKDEIDFKFVKKGMFSSKVVQGKLAFTEGAVGKSFFEMGKPAPVPGSKPKVEQIPVIVCPEMGSKAQVQLSSGVPVRIAAKAATGFRRG
ncbi:hypothetical protein BASA81_005593 [Batrachochytrium salamandrivorans]|nr:hypothetical protein BASA81_005593 [Batrachochytrium salamandrivorans]